MIVEETGIHGLLQVKRAPGTDERGFFREVCRGNKLGQFITDDWQINHSRTYEGGIRGIHGELWDKLVFVVTGIAFLAIADLRPESETFSRHQTFTFDCKNELPYRALFIPRGLGNSVCAKRGGGDVNYVYFTNAYWTPGSSFDVNPYDSDLNIDWPVSDPIISEKDKKAPSLRERFPDKFRR